MQFSIKGQSEKFFFLFRLYKILTYLRDACSDRESLPFPPILIMLATLKKLMFVSKFLWALSNIWLFVPLNQTFGIMGWWTVQSNQIEILFFFLQLSQSICESYFLWILNKKPFFPPLKYCSRYFKENCYLFFINTI